MSINLQKGQKVDLTKGNAGLSRLIVGLGWDEAGTKNPWSYAAQHATIDCDAAALMLQGGKLKDKITNIGFIMPRKGVKIKGGNKNACKFIQGSKG